MSLEETIEKEIEELEIVIKKRNFGVKEEDFKAMFNFKETNDYAWSLCGDQEFYAGMLNQLKRIREMFKTEVKK